MRIDVRPVGRLRGANPLNVPAALGPVFDALGSADVDLARVRVVCDWIQYRSNFAGPVECRPVLAERPARPPAAADAGGRTADAGGRTADARSGTADAGGGTADAGGGTARSALEIAVDLRRCASDGSLTTSVKEAVAALSGEGPAAHTVLEPWVPASRSCIWRFNTLYWQALSRWEQVTGQEYEQALPGGQSDARNTEAVRELIFELLAVWDDLDSRRALPEELYIAELGVGNGHQARTWLDEFAAIDRAHGRDYYRRLHYLMGDYSPHVLERARRTVAHHGERVSALVLDATAPQVTLGFLRGKAFLIYISNVYDNLPTDEVATIGGRPYVVEVRACLPEADAARIAHAWHTFPAGLPPLIERLLRLGPDLLAEAAPDQFTDAGAAVAFWRDVWVALRLQQRYVPLDGLDAYHVTPEVTGEILRPLLEGNGDIRMHVSNGALASFAGTLPLLHPYGRLICHDLFLTEPGGYHAGFYGPGKYDGSIVNWANGPLLQLAGNRRGYHVQITPFRARPSSNVKTLTAQVRD